MGSFPKNLKSPSGGGRSQVIRILGSRDTSGITRRSKFPGLTRQLEECIIESMAFYKMIYVNTMRTTLDYFVDISPLVISPYKMRKQDTDIYINLLFGVPGTQQ